MNPVIAPGKLNVGRVLYFLPGRVNKREGAETMTILIIIFAAGKCQEQEAEADKNR